MSTNLNTTKTLVLAVTLEDGEFVSSRITRVNGSNRGETFGRLLSMARVFGYDVEVGSIRKADQQIDIPMGFGRVLRLVQIVNQRQCRVCGAKIGRKTKGCPVCYDRMNLMYWEIDSLKKTINE